MQAVVSGRVRGLLTSTVHSAPMARALSVTMVQGKNHGPLITVSRIPTRQEMLALFVFTLP